MTEQNIEYGPCPVCGTAIYHTDTSRYGKCDICGETSTSYYTCSNAHLVCDKCMLESIAAPIFKICYQAESKNPFVIAEELMNIPNFGVLGCRNSIIPSIALILAYKNCGGRVPDIANIIKSVEERLLMGVSSLCKKGGFCGIPMTCSAGLYVILRSRGIDTDTISEYINQLTNQCIKKVVDVKIDNKLHNCCKRHVYISIDTSVKFLKDNFKIELSVPEKTYCKYSDKNSNCEKSNCLYYKK